MMAFVLLELFTSEACSSCPPADELLAEIAKDGVIGVSLHVDYWNDLGWEDPFSKGVPATQRQAEYAKIARSRTYTPQAVVDGRYECIGGERECIERAVAKARNLDKAKLRVQCGGDKVSVSGPGGDRLTVAWVSKLVKSEATRGENAGKTLTHAWVARKLDTREAWSGKSEHTGKSDRVIAYTQNHALEVTGLGFCDL